MKIQLDHLVWAHPHLDEATESFQKESGVSPKFGGQHLNLGTHNSLVSLGPDSYLELISPDPSNKIPNGVKVLGIGQLKEPQIVGWAINGPLKEMNYMLKDSGFNVSGINSGSRMTPEGQELKWNYFILDEAAFNEIPQIAPFFIQWIGEIPAKISPVGCNICDFWGEHPHPEQFQKLFDTLSFHFPVKLGPSPRLKAIIKTPKALLEI